jgi:hypothetical protein
LHSRNENDDGEFIPVQVIQTDTRRSFMEQIAGKAKNAPLHEKLN